MASTNINTDVGDIVTRVCAEIWKVCANAGTRPVAMKPYNLMGFQLITYGDNTTEKFCLLDMKREEAKCVSTCLVPGTRDTPAAVAILLGQEDRKGEYVARRVTTVPLGNGSSAEMKMLYQEVRNGVDEAHGTRTSALSIIKLVVESQGAVYRCLIKGTSNPFDNRRLRNRVIT
jgi:hypothetical protein